MLVKPQYFTFAEDEPFYLRNGESLHNVTLEYETYGTLNENRDNVILVLHALSGSAHAAGYHSRDDRYPGWWDTYIGPGKPFDTDRFYIISSNVLGGCSGSTGPASVNSQTGKSYGTTFPFITIKDMVNAQYHLVKSLGIDNIHAVAGGSMGGMQALAWSIQYPEMVGTVIAIATSASISAQGIAFNEVARQAIMRDPLWKEGDYNPEEPPRAGLSLARMIGHITYLSEKHMHEKFGRRFLEQDLNSFDFNPEFEVESYLHYQGNKFVDRFDANSYLYITRAIDYFDLAEDYGSLVKAFENAQSNFLVVSFTSDWLYPSPMAKDIVRALRINGINVHYTDIETDKGHDAFLVPNPPLEQTIRSFLVREHEKRQHE